jgi:hypothetical protein
MAVKECTKCGLSLPLDGFYSYKRKSRDYVSRDSWCIDCTKAASRVAYERQRDSGAERERGWRRRGIVGVTWEDFERKYADQDGRCSVCQNPMRLKGVGKGKQDVAHLDHNHSTGKPRGLLCGNCNVAIGMLGDDIELLRSAVAYLEEYE